MREKHISASLSPVKNKSKLLHALLPVSFSCEVARTHVKSKDLYKAKGLCSSQHREAGEEGARPETSDVGRSETLVNSSLHDGKRKRNSAYSRSVRAQG
jgi:hypothetical protein